MATVDVFPGAIYLLDGSIDFLACALWDELYENRSSRKTDSQLEKRSSVSSILLKIVSENRFPLKTYFYTIASSLALYVSVKRHEGIYGTLGRKQNSRLRDNHDEKNDNKAGISC